MQIKKVLKILVQLSPLLMIVLMGVMYMVYFRSLTLEQMMNFTPSEPIAAAAVILLMYGLKSLSYFFPMMLIAAASGAIFPLYAAIPINLVGIVIMSTMPYLIGRFVESEAVDKLAVKYKKIDEIRSFGNNHEFFGAFFLRIVSCLPYDVVSLAMGSLRFSYKKYVIGSFLGTAPGIILTTIMGSAITEPFSPEFIICASIEIILSIASFVIYRIYHRHEKD